MLSRHSMSQKTVEASAILRDLGDGLVLRRGAVEDADAVADLLAEINGVAGIRDETIAIWTRDLFAGRLPTFTASDFTLVEDTNSGAIASMQNLISQTWSYGGVEFGVGRIELVATDPAYRRRGLIRAQMDVVHEWSAQRGEKVQAITGIPWFYRQFGYEMALDNRDVIPPLLVGRGGYRPNVPELKEGEPEAYHLRPATREDLPVIGDIYDQGMRRYLVSCVRDQELWRYELDGHTEGSSCRSEIRVVDTANGEPVGFLMHESHLSGNRLSVSVYELRPDMSWTAVTPSVIRYLLRTGEEYATRDGLAEGLGAFAFLLGKEHPVFGAISDWLPRPGRYYAWYLRIPDLPDFIRHIAPVLERRLAESTAAGYTGELKISFIVGGLRLSFKGGRLARVENWQTTQEDSRYRPIARDALFPGLIFTQVLFGYRSVEELEYAFPDCVITPGKARELLNMLFPKQPSFLWGVE